MIVFLTILYVAVLLLLVKLKILPWNLWTKISPVLWVLFLTVALFIPLQFYAPAGDVRVMVPTVQIVPNIAGEVIEVVVGPNARVHKDDVLFRIDPVPFEARVRALEAQLAEAKQAVPQLAAALDAAAANRAYWEEEAERMSAAVETAAVSRSQFEKAKFSLAAAKAEEERARLAYQSEFEGENTAVAKIEAQLVGARYDLEQTVVRSPGDGVATNVATLQAGTRVVAAPLRQAMVVVLDSKRVLLAQVQQIFLRHIRTGQSAEIVFKVFPGEVFQATVEAVLPGSADGQIAPTGQLLAPRPATPGPLFVRLLLDDAEVAKRLPAGAAGTVAIYTGKFEISYIIRRVMLRMKSWTDYVLPF